MGVFHDSFNDPSMKYFGVNNFKVFLNYFSSHFKSSFETFTVIQKCWELPPVEVSNDWNWIWRDFIKLQLNILGFTWFIKSPANAKLWG